MRQHCLVVQTSTDIKDHKTLESSKTICFHRLHMELVVSVVNKWEMKEVLTEPRDWEGEQRLIRGEKMPEKLKEIKVRINLAHKLIFCFKTTNDAISKHIIV